MIAAFLLAIAGVDEAAIVEDYALTERLSGLLLARLRERALARGTNPRLIDIVLRSEPHNMQKAFDHLREKHGGLSPYLATLGLSQQAREQLATRLKET
ncbi:tyrosine phosphatase family protein [Rhizobium sp. BK376]|nr:tyrosine phosphatase family protein [Rhizobium sp. BK376]